MYVVTVEFHIRPPHFAAFLPLMRENAQASLRIEPGCRQFDVCTDPARPSSLFLYEVYDDRSAFEAHLASEHFTRFDAAVRDMVAGKLVRTLQRVEPTEPHRPAQL
jgi:autoinducer 2-degrading protein